MEEIFKTLTSASWWVTAVLFGVLINLFSAYLKSPLDRLGARLFRHWRLRTSDARSKYDSEVHSLRMNENLQFHTLLEALRLRANANGWLIVCAVSAVMYSMGLQVFVMKVLAKMPTSEPGAGYGWFDEVPLALSLLAILSAAFNAARARLKEDLVAEARRPRVNLK